MRPCLALLTCCWTRRRPFCYSAQSGIDEARDFMVFHKYDDAIVLALVGAAVEVLGRWRWCWRRCDPGEWASLRAALAACL